MTICRAVALSLLVCACGSKPPPPPPVDDAGQPATDAGASCDGGGPYFTYLHLAVTCTPCAADALALEFAGTSAVNCGRYASFSGDDAGVLSCISGELDGGGAFMAFIDDVGLDTSLSRAIARDDAGVVRIFRYDSFSTTGEPCHAVVTVSSCSSPSFDAAADGGLVCGSEQPLNQSCDESQTRQIVDAGFRPLSELRCDDAFELCRVGASIGKVPPDDAPMVCTDAYDTFERCSRSPLCAPDAG